MTKTYPTHTSGSAWMREKSCMFMINFFLSLPLLISIIKLSTTAILFYDSLAFHKHFCTLAKRQMLSMSTNNLSYSDQGGTDSAVEVGQETTPTSSNAGAGFGLFSVDFKK